MLGLRNLDHRPASHPSTVRREPNQPLSAPYLQIWTVILLARQMGGGDDLCERARRCVVCAPVIRCFGENSRCDIDFAVFYILPVPPSLTAKWRRVKIGSPTCFLRAHHARNTTPPRAFDRYNSPSAAGKNGVKSGTKPIQYLRKDKCEKHNNKRHE